MSFSLFHVELCVGSHHVKCCVCRVRITVLRCPHSFLCVRLLRQLHNEMNRQRIERQRKKKVDRRQKKAERKQRLWADTGAGGCGSGGTNQIGDAGEEENGGDEDPEASSNDGDGGAGQCALGQSRITERGGYLGSLGLGGVGDELYTFLKSLFLPTQTRTHTRTHPYRSFRP